MVILGNGILTAEISETGAQLSRLADKDTEYLWNADPEVWARHAPILFPFVARLPEQQYRYRGKMYGPLKNHGIAPYARFMAESSDSTSCTMLMVVTDEIRQLYPFDFDFRVRYRLDGHTLHISYLVSNRGEGDMFYAIGSHPGFNVPISKNLKFEDYYVEFPEAGNVMQRLFTADRFVSDDDVPYPLEDNRIPLHHDLFDDDAICMKNTGYTAVIRSDKDLRSITVRYPDTPWCAIWHIPKRDARYVCIEPWFSLPGKPGINDIEKRDDFQRLHGGESAEYDLSITIGN